MAQDGDSAEQMAEIMNELIADAARADDECKRLQQELARSLEEEMKLLRDCDEAKMQGERYRLQRDYLVSLMPDEHDPFNTVHFVQYLANTLNQIEAEGDLASDSDTDSDMESD